MAESPRSQPATAGDAGFAAHLRGFFASFADYSRVRLQLAGIESKEAGVHYLKLLIYVVIALVVVVFGYLFLCIGAVVLLAQLLRVGWPWVMVGFALLHFVGAGVCVFLAKAGIAEPMFGATLRELKKDKEWLSSPR